MLNVFNAKTFLCLWNELATTTRVQLNGQSSLGATYNKKPFLSYLP